VSPTSVTPAHGVQLIDASQWRAIVAVAVLALAALCVGLVALLRPRAHDAAQTPVVRVAAPVDGPAVVTSLKAGYGAAVGERCCDERRR
jgi:hypothetical protein